MSSTEEGALLRVLEVTRQLGGSLELHDLLGQVIDAARDLLSADRGTVFLFDDKTNELYSTVATGAKQIRFPADRGIAGECAQGMAIVNVSDAYNDPRFNADVDRKTGYHTRCILSVPLMDHDNALVGVLQLLNKMPEGVFDDHDEQIAQALAAQCAVAIKRAVLIEEHLVKEKLERDLALAREIQSRVLPGDMPQIAGYDLAGWSRSAEETGGDIYDLIELPGGGLTVLLGDATGHGIGPALSVTQVRAMVRMAVRLGASLGDVVTHVNNQLCDDLPTNRFVTAFFGELDPADHTFRYHAGGQGPILHYHAASDECEWLDASTFPLGIMPDMPLDEPKPLTLEPGDIVGLISDGIYEYANHGGEQFGDARVAELLLDFREQPMDKLILRLREAVADFARGAPQEDDMTIVFVKRES